MLRAAAVSVSSPPPDSRMSSSGGVLDALVVAGRVAVVAATLGLTYMLFDKLVLAPERSRRELTSQIAKKLGKSEADVPELDAHELALTGDVICNKDIGVSFSDIGGLGPEIEEVMDNVIVPMRHWKELVRINGASTAPSGVLLYGKPGTGKTMMAKAIAKGKSALYYCSTWDS